jgi:hypothetical protein
MLYPITTPERRDILHCFRSKEQLTDKFDLLFWHQLDDTKLADAFLDISLIQNSFVKAGGVTAAA